MRGAHQQGIDASEPVRDLLPWFSPGLVVGRSPIHGRGVFVRASVPSGSVLIRFGGYFLPLSARYEDRVIPSTAIGVSKQVVLAEVQGASKDLSDYLNHSCQPTAGFKDAITLVAAQDLVTGDEVTVDYAYWEADETWQLRTACTCGAFNCRVHVTGVDWRREEIRARLSRWASPFIRRRLFELSTTHRRSD